MPGFEKFFGRALDKQNRWIKLSEVIPWEEFAKAYNQNMSSGRGRPAKAARLVIGAVIIKHKLCLSNDETIDQIRENPYLQYFVGLSTFQTKAPFAPSLFVDIRRRMGEQVFESFNQSIIDKLESKKVEFGAKIEVSLTGDGLAHVDHLEWNSYYEGHDLPNQVEEYKKRHGHYPEVVIGDPLYGSRKNRKYLSNQKIRFSGKALGRPKKETEENQKQLRDEAKRRKAEYRERIPIEGKFGQGKNGYRLNYIRARTQATSEAWIRTIFLVMNLLVLTRSFLRRLKMMRYYSYSVVKELFLEFDRLARVVSMPDTTIIPDCPV